VIYRNAKLEHWYRPYPVARLLEFIHSFKNNISVAPLQLPYYSKALLTTAR